MKKKKRLRGKYSRSGSLGLSKVQHAILDVLDKRPESSVYQIASFIGYNVGNTLPWDNEVSLRRSLSRLKDRGFIAVTGKNRNGGLLWSLIRNGQADLLPETIRSFSYIETNEHSSLNDPIGEEEIKDFGE